MQIRAFLVMVALTASWAADANKWRDGILLRQHHEGKYQVYEIDSQDTSDKQCLLVVREERGQQFKPARITPGKPIRYSVQGTAVSFLDADGNERPARIWKQILRKR